jgi:hypothetical protein
MFPRSFFILIFCHTFVFGQSRQPQLDGVITHGEYVNAGYYNVNGDGQVLIMKRDQRAYVALFSRDKIWSHVYLYHKDTIHVFHASAALGKVAYVRNGDEWSPRGKFVYTVRDRVYDDALRKKQEAYLKENGWVANNNNTGDGNTLEFCLDLTRWRGEDVRMAFVFMSDIKKPMFYPSTLKDDTLLEALLYGGDPPEGMRFEIGDWLSPD